MNECFYQTAFYTTLYVYAHPCECVCVCALWTRLTVNCKEVLFFSFFEEKKTQSTYNNSLKSVCLFPFKFLQSEMRRVNSFLCVCTIEWSAREFTSDILQNGEEIFVKTIYISINSLLHRFKIIETVNFTFEMLMVHFRLNESVACQTNREKKKAKLNINLHKSCLTEEV